MWKPRNPISAVQDWRSAKRQEKDIETEYGELREAFDTIAAPYRLDGLFMIGRSAIYSVGVLNEIDQKLEKTRTSLQFSKIGDSLLSAMLPNKSELYSGAKNNLTEAKALIDSLSDGGSPAGAQMVRAKALHDELRKKGWLPEPTKIVLDP